MNRHQTQLSLDIVIAYDILEPIEVADYVLPPMIELRDAYLELQKEDGKKARVNILKVLSESQRMLLEDEIIDAIVQERS